MPFSQSVHQSLYLLSVPNFGPASYWGLIEQCGSLDAVFNSSVQPSKHCKAPMQDALMQSKKKGNCAALWQHIDALCDWLDAQNIHVLDCAHPDYPLLLKSIDKPPPLLFVKGNINTLSLPQMAIVGSRKITIAGEKTTSTFAQELAKAGFTITSGLALGVDAVAHEGALSANGKTVAVMATGIDAIYPKKHQYLADKIIEQDGALVTEFFPHSSPKAHHFPQRNRIISGLSCGLLVVEAALKSGSLISARYATEQNREVFAVPGSIHSPVSRGCHMLIKNGAKLVETGQDIVEELGSMLSLYANTPDDYFKELDNKTPHSNSPQTSPLNVQKNKKQASEHTEKTLINEPLDGQHMTHDDCHVLQSIDFSMTSLDDILAHAKLPMDELMSKLLELELEGVISHSGAGYTRLK